MILETLLILCVITGIVLIVLDYLYIGIGILIVGTLVFSYLLYRYFQKVRNTALDILSLQGDKRLFDKLCDKLFKIGGDKETYMQYLDMKTKRSEYESQNLCKNFAKIKVKQI